jgi:hypothetical protein
MKSVVQSLTVALILFLVPCFASGADESADGAALLKRAAQLSGMENGKPFRASFSVRLFGTSQGTVQGTMLFFRESATRWRREFHLTGFDSIEVVSGDRMWRVRSLPYTPALVRKLSGAPLDLSELPNESVKRVSSRKLNDVPVRCAEIKREKGITSETWCFFDNGVPAAYYSADERVEYSDYAETSGRLIPSKVRFFQNSILAAEAIMGDHGTDLPEESNLLSPPVGAQERPWCEHIVHARAISTPDPNFPQEMHGHQVRASTMYEIGIGVDGRVESISPLTTRSVFDPVTLESLKKWRFQPAMCGNTPVPSEVQVNFEFSSY